MNGKIKQYDRRMYGGGYCHRIEYWFGSDRYIYADVIPNYLRVGGESNTLYVTFGYEVLAPCEGHGGDYIPEWYRGHLTDLIREVLEYYCQVRHRGERLVLEIDISK